EKSRATDQDAAASLAARAPARADPMDEFKLIDIDEAPKIPTPAGKSAVPPRAAAAGAAKPAPKVAVGRTVIQPAAPPPPPPGKPRGRPSRGAAPDSRGPQTLEETLEIPGASQVSMDTGRGATLHDSGLRHLRVEVQRNSPFSKLLERLSERMKKS